MSRYLLEVYPWLLAKLQKHGCWCVFDSGLWFKVKLNGALIETTIIGSKYNG